MSKKITAELQEEEPRYRVTDGTVSWDYKRGTITISVEDLDEIFYQYSKHGLNMSQVQVQNKHGFNALEWQSVKRTFDLVKDSDVFSPYSLSQVSEKEACDMIAQKIAEKYSPKNMRAVIEYEDGKQRRKAYDSAVKKANEMDYRRHLFEDGLAEYVSQAKPTVVTATKTARDTHAIVHVCDLHVGAEIEAERNLPAFNAKVIADKLSRVATEVNQRNPRKVTLVINGDLIETFTGLNHINSWKNVDKKYGYGVQATIKAIEILTGFISQVHNIQEVIVISGNHDRVTSSNKEDVDGEVTQWVHYVLQKTFAKIKVVLSKDVYSLKVDNCGFVFTHGHLGISKRNPDHIVNQYGLHGLFNLVVMAHLHTRKVLADGLFNRTVHAPSIFTGNQYSKGLGYSSLAGFLYITVKGKHPIVADVPLP